VVKPNTFALVCLLILYGFLFQGWRGLWGGDEGRYTAASVEMLRLRSLTRLQLSDHTPHYTKPPLTYAAMAASMAAFGRNEWAARLPNAAAFVLTVLLVHQLARRSGLKRPRLAAAIYAGAPLPFAAANIITTDTLLVLWHACAAAAFMASWKAGTPWRRRGWTTLLWLALGLAFMTKGPPSLLPLAAFVAFAALCGGWRAVGALFWLPAVALFSAVGLSWYIAVILEVPGLWDYWMHRELAGRALGTVKNHGGAWYAALTIYAPVLLLGLFPWVWYLMRDVRRAGRFFRAEYWKNVRAGGEPFLFLLLWASVPIGIFFVVPSRQPLYLLPSFVPLSLLAASRVERAWAGATEPGRRIQILWLTAWLCVLLAGRASLGLMSDKKDARALSQAILRQCPTAFRRITFVDVYSPRYGLKLYLDTQVDNVTLAPTETWNRFGPPPRLLAAKLAQGETEDVFLVGRRSVEAFSAGAAAGGFQAHTEGEAQGLCLVRLTPSL
jgi:4-amino-4-deoxy-L-arabinose transferase-like glycosyltransferase